jgi:hypothetical protein
MTSARLEDLGPLDRAFRRAAHAAIRAYQLTLSAFVGRTCRHLPTCSCYMDEAICRHGLWAGGWMGAARLWRCRPFGTSGFDPIPRTAPLHARPWLPWRYGRWRGPLENRAPPRAARRLPDQRRFAIRAVVHCLRRLFRRVSRETT